MNAAAPAVAADIHPHGCACAACEPYLVAQADRASLADTLGMLTAPAFGAGLLVAWIVDRLIGGPGISVMWGA